MTRTEYIEACGELAIMRRIAEHFSGRTLDNIIANYEAAIKAYEDRNGKEARNENSI